MREVHVGERLTRIDYRRTKTDTLARLVPLHSEYSEALRDQISRYALRLGVRFGMFGRHELENMPERALRVGAGRGGRCA